MVVVMGDKTYRKWRTRRWNSVEALTKTLSQMRNTMQMMVAELDRTDDTVLDVAQKLKGQAVVLRELEENISCIEHESASRCSSGVVHLIPHATNLRAPPLTHKSSDLRMDTSVLSSRIPTPRPASYQWRLMQPVERHCFQSSHLVYSPSTVDLPVISEDDRNYLYTHPFDNSTAVIYAVPSIVPSETVECSQNYCPVGYSQPQQPCVKPLESEVAAPGSPYPNGCVSHPPETNTVAKFLSECSSQTSYACTTSPGSSSSESSSSSSSPSSTRAESTKREMLSDSRTSIRETRTSSTHSRSSQPVSLPRSPTPDSTRAPPPSRNESTPPTVHEVLAKAVDGGKVKVVTDLLHAGLDVNVYTAGRTPLHRACAKANVTFVSMLLKQGADVEAKDCYGRSPLHIAAYHDNYGLCVTLLIEAGADIFSRTRWGLTPLHYAAQCGNEATVRALVAAGASNTLEDVKGRTPFDLAKTVCVHRLLRQGTRKSAHSQIVKNPIAKYAPIRLPYTTSSYRGLKRSRCNTLKENS